MKKVLLILIMGLTLSTAVSADKIEYYSATNDLITKMGKEGTATSTFFYTPVTVVSAVVETVLSPTVWFWNLFQEENKETSVFIDRKDIK